MSKHDDNWGPSRRQMQFDWYLARVLRMLGGGMIVWELAVDSGKNPLVLLLGGMLATAKDALATGLAYIRQAKAEDKDMLGQLKTQRREDDPHDRAEM